MVKRLHKRLRTGGANQKSSNKESRGIHRVRLLCGVSVLGTTQSRKPKTHTTSRL